MTTEHKIVPCRCKRKKIESVCNKYGTENYTCRGNFFSRFLFIFKRNYLVFVRSGTQEAFIQQTPPDASQYESIKTKAIIGFILSVLGIFFVIGFPISCVCLHQYNEAARAGLHLKGKGFSIAGIVFGCFYILEIIALIAYFFIRQQLL